MPFTLDYSPKPKQVLFHKSMAEECFFGGAKSPGKSCALTMEAIQMCLDMAREGRPYEAYLFRRTYDDLEANLIAEFLKRCPRELYEYDKAKHNAKMPGRTMIKFRHIATTADAYRYNGRSIPWIGVDELTEHEEQGIQVLLSCNRSADGVPIRFRATGNPGNKGHKWVQRRYIHGTNYGKDIVTDPVTGNRIQFIPATVYDGVLVERDPAYVKRLENLPETERRAYLLGDWDIFEGQFFGNFGSHNREEPFVIPEQDDTSRIFASLDHGIAHYTSFGLYWADTATGTIHRIFTYYMNGGTTRSHAEAIIEAIEACRFSRYLYPCEIFYDYAMETKHRISEQHYRSDLDEYMDAFKTRLGGRDVKWSPANKRKVDGCHLMRQVFDIGNGAPIFRYFDGLNDGFVESVTNVLTDKLNPEQYAKMDGDDGADESRYGIMGIVARMATLQNRAKKAEKKDKQELPRPLELARQYGGLA